MKNRMIALALTLALLFALGANAASTEAQRAEEPPAAEAAPAAGPAETAAPDAAADPSSAPEAAAPDAAGALRFADLRGRMLERCYPLLALEENIRTLEEWDYDRTENELRDALNAIASQQFAAMSAPTLDPAAMAGLPPEQLIAAQAGVAGAAAASAVVSPIVQAQLQSQYDACRKAFDDVRSGKLQADNEGVKHQLRSLQDQTVIVGESLYITLKGLDAQDAALTRAIAAAKRTEREMTLRQELGQLSALTLRQVRAGITQAESGQKTLRMNRDSILLQLKAMTGAELDGPLTLGALPAVTAEQLAAMDLERDLASAREASYELYDAKKTCDAAKKDYDDARKEYGAYSTKNEWMQAKHSWQAAQYTYENAKQSYELKFRALSARVTDAAQVLDARREALALEEKSYAVSALKYEQGTISKNALADAADALAEARDAVASAQRDLFSQYRSYQWAVSYGILNS